MSTVPGAVPPTSAILRTRMSWIRTSLAVIITGFLIVRSGLTNGEPLAIAFFSGILSVIVVTAAVTRFKIMGHGTPPILTGQTPRVITGGILVLAVIACIQMIMRA